uniref:ZP domain-containing protein n=1 Tax=Enterobius vermicularis TaxID=51028 RepID=A0A0N4V296_ENTVE
LCRNRRELYVVINRYLTEHILQRLTSGRGREEDNRSFGLDYFLISQVNQRSSSAFHPDHIVMLLKFLVWLSVLLVLADTRESSAVYNNRIKNEPEVQCGHGVITVKVRTETKRPSYIFAKGHFRNPECSFHNSNVANFTFEHCNINRKREVNPKGMAYSLTVIVQLHPLFITKVDRAYNVRCFYMEENKEVNAEFAVSDLMTTVIESGHPMPQCSYTLHRDSPNGPVLRYARVGDLVYHVWDCPSEVYAMLVHTCSILDGHGDEHIVVDSTGYLYNFLNSAVNQTSLNSVVTLTHSFLAGANVVNLPDSESVYFSCQIKLCLKSGDYCSQITPPRCGYNDAIHGETIEEVLDSDQLIATTAALPTTSAEVNYTTMELPSIISLIRNISEGISNNETAKFLATPDSILEYIVRDMDENVHKDNFSDTVEGSGDEVVTIKPITNPKALLRFKKSMKASNDEIVDVDVSTPELRIIENEFGKNYQNRSLTSNNNNYQTCSGFPDFNAQQSLIQSKDAVCLPLLGIWFLTIVTIVALTAAIIAVYRSRYTRQKLSLVY